MDLLGRVFIMALCVLAAYGLPSLTDGRVESRIPRAATTVSPPPTSNNTQSACTAKFTNDVKEIYNTTVIQTEQCYKSAEAVLDDFDGKILNKSVGNINAISKTIQLTLANCSAKTSNVDTLKCYIEIFDATLANLNNITSEAQVAASSINDVEHLTEMDAKLCVNGVLVSNKMNSSIAANDLQKCLSKTSVGNVGGRSSLLSDLSSKILKLN